ncbi:MAG: cytochrome c [Hyphomicrobium sp.]|nr:cytochrome c [Hyphomicrobium sp.]
MALAQRLCSGCHLVEGREGTVPAGIPSLKGIANTKGQTGKRIEQTLIQPHTPMPDMLLTRDEIRHLLAYLETLRTNPEIAPLFQPADPDKPAYPKPS